LSDDLRDYWLNAFAMVTLKRRSQKEGSAWKRHSLSIVTGAILATWVLLYIKSDENSHWGSFFGNAIADWSGLMITIITTKFLFESGSKQSRKELKEASNPVLGVLKRHSLSLFFVVTGSGWIYVFRQMKTTSKWGQVVGNLLSEWTQILGLILLTKKFFEVHSKE
jgi:hypothetical protein